MASTRASISKVSKRPKINIIPPKQLFVDLTQDDTKTPSPKLPNSSPSAPNAPSKTPSTKDTSSSSIDYIPKSPTSSTSPSPNGYLNPSTSPPPRVSPPPPTQDNASMDITLTLSPNTPLDVQFDTPSPSPPIIAHPIPWNFLEAHDLDLEEKEDTQQHQPVHKIHSIIFQELDNMDSIMGKMCLGKDVIEISSDRNEGSGDWDSPEYKDTAGSGGKKEPQALVFHKMYTEEDSDRYIAQCFVNGLYASDGEINLEKNDNLISNDYAVKLCLEYEVRKGKKLVKKELIVLLRGEIYFVQFIINPEEDEFEPGLVFGRSFLRTANAIVNFTEGTISIQPDFDPFLLSSDEERNPNLDNSEMLLDFDFDEVQQTETDLPPMVCKMGKGNRNKKKIMENIMYFNNGDGPSLSIGTPLTQEEAEKRALAYNISIRYEILEEVRLVIETLAYNDKYRKLLDEIWADKVRLDGKFKPEEERAMIKVKGQMLKEKKDSMAFIFPIRLEGLINENALADTGSNTNTMPYRIYEQLGRDDIMKEERNITMINY
ncbi:hypothetical protein Tco_1095871, partial [Tanacetum coccineum]